MKRAALGVTGALTLAACAGVSAPAAQEAAPGGSGPPFTAGIGGAGPPAGAGVLEGTIWTVTTLNDAEIAPAHAPTLAFQGRGVTGSTGCNRYFGQVSVTRTGLIFSPMGVSRRACAPEIMDLETDFLAALSAIDSFALHGDDRLVLSAGPDVVIEAEPSR